MRLLLALLFISCTPRVRLCTQQPTDGGLCVGLFDGSVRINSYELWPVENTTGQCAAPIPCPPVTR